MRNARRLVGVLVFLAAVPQAHAATVQQVVDGDTVRLTSGATVDLLGIRAGTACGTDGAATLGALLPHGAKVRLVRDGRRRGAYVFRGSSFVNRELVEAGSATAARLRGLRRARALRAAQRTARTLRLGVWSCATAPAAGGGGGTLSPEAEIDAYVRGHRFTVRDEGGSGADAYSVEMVMQFCTDGRVVASMTATGIGNHQATGSWKPLGVARRDEQAFLGRFEVVFKDDEGKDNRDEILIGRLADGSAVVGDEEDQMPARRAPADGC